jgi:hypothetical protein
VKSVRARARAHHGVKLLVRRIEQHHLRVQRCDTASHVGDEIELHAAQEHIDAESLPELGDLPVGHLGV